MFCLGIYGNGSNSIEGNPGAALCIKITNKNALRNMLDVGWKQRIDINSNCVHSRLFWTTRLINLRLVLLRKAIHKSELDYGDVLFC